MKKRYLLAAIFMFAVIILSGCANNSVGEGEILRIHIRANSNAHGDQSVKMAVKERVVDYLSLLTADFTDFDKAVEATRLSLDTVERIANQTLKENGYYYSANAYMTREYFPARSYGDVVVESGTYDAVIVELGAAKGDNWWCVIYPPLCFVGREDYGSDFAYKSKIAEIWRKFFS